VGDQFDGSGRWQERKFIKVFIKWLLSSVTAENHGDIMLGNVNVYIPEEYRKDETDESTGWTIKRKHQGRQ
jgi:hypothetical protein